MKFTHLIAIAGIALFLQACGNDMNRLNVVDSESFSEKEITLDDRITRHLLADSLLPEPEIVLLEPNSFLKNLNEMISLSENIRKNQSDSSWIALSASWRDFRKNNVRPDGMPVIQSSTLPDSATIMSLLKWAELNINLLKFSGEVRFGDALEKLLYESKVAVLTKKILKSVIYTHIDDQIFINIIGSSSMNYQHTTGGIVKLIQETDYPAGNEMTLKCECGDIRFMDVFIRIPSWAINPTVTHGNVKYVARPGEYCEISRKWQNGDEIRVVLMN